MSQTLETIFRYIEEEKSRLAAVVVHMNDTYLIDERANRKLPGFPKVIATISHLRNHVKKVMGKDRTLVVHSGDFLAPSLVGLETKGRAMIELLKRMELDWCVLGNHEFDYGEEQLTDRLKDPTIGVTLSNVETPIEKIKEVVYWPPEHEHLIAITGVVSETVHNGFPRHWKFLDPKEKLLNFKSATAKVPFRIVLTHAAREEDRKMRKVLPSRTYILGGHDHDIDWPEADDEAIIFKNKSNLETITVLLLLAGGGQSRDTLRHESYQLGKRRALEQEGKEDRAGTQPLNQLNSDKWASLVSFPHDCEEVLAQIPSADAEVFKKIWKEQNLNSENFSCTMREAINSLPEKRDFMYFLLRADDHNFPANPSDEEFVLAQMKGEIDTTVIKDASSIAPEGIDFSDDLLRHRPAPVGTFAAECIRKMANADFAILNAGSFRVDGVLPAKLIAHDLKECFLYDREDAIVVLPLPREAVRVMLEHGRKIGNGGYPQTSQQEIPEKDELLVAITSYLLENDHSLDKYEIALAAFFKISVEALRIKVKGSAQKRFSIIAAIREFAGTTDISPLKPNDEELPAIEKFIQMADALYKANPNFGSKSWDCLKEDEPIPQESDLTIARDAIRSWLRTFDRNASFLRRQIPISEVQRTEGYIVKHIELHGEEDSYVLLIDLYDALQNHPATFEKGRKYASIFNSLANGIGGWITY